MASKKPKPLVTQHLEQVSRKAIEKYPGVLKEYTRKRNGIYVLYRKGKIYYVGLASNLRMRLNAHLKDKHKKKWDSFSVYLTIGEDHMKELESLRNNLAHSQDIVTHDWAQIARMSRSLQQLMNLPSIKGGSY